MVKRLRLSCGRQGNRGLIFRHWPGIRPSIVVTLWLNPHPVIPVGSPEEPAGASPLALDDKGGMNAFQFLNPRKTTWPSVGLSRVPGQNTRVSQNRHHQCNHDIKDAELLFFLHGSENPCPFPGGPAYLEKNSSAACLFYINSMILIRDVSLSIPLQPNNTTKGVFLCYYG